MPTETSAMQSPPAWLIRWPADGDEYEAIEKFGHLLVPTIEWDSREGTLFGAPIKARHHRYDNDREQYQVVLVYLDAPIDVHLVFDHLNGPRHVAATDEMEIECTRGTLRVLARKPPDEDTSYAALSYVDEDVLRTYWQYGTPVPVFVDLAAMIADVISSGYTFDDFVEGLRVTLKNGLRYLA